MMEREFEDVINLWEGFSSFCTAENQQCVSENAGVHSQRIRWLENMRESTKEWTPWPSGIRLLLLSSPYYQSASRMWACLPWAWQRLLSMTTSGCNSFHKYLSLKMQMGLNCK